MINRFRHIVARFGRKSGGCDYFNGVLIRPERIYGVPLKGPLETTSIHSCQRGRNSRRRKFRCKIFRHLDFSPYGVFTVRNFRRQNFSPYEIFAVLNFCRTEFSLYGMVAVMLQLRGFIVLSNS